MSHSKHDTEQPFLARWSQRKSAARRGEPLEEPAPPAKAEVPPAPAEPPAPPELPPIESLDENSDYSVFFAEGVGEAVRRAALRRLFSSPSLNITDGLDDYCEDFTCFPSLGDVVTHDMRRMWRIEEERRRAREAAEGEQRPEPEPVETAEPEPVETAPVLAQAQEPARPREAAAGQPQDDPDTQEEAPKHAQ